MSQLSAKPSIRVIVLTTFACLVGLVLRTVWPEWVLPETSFTLYAVILILSHGAEPKIANHREEGFHWLVSVAALTLLPAICGVSEEPLWKMAIIDGVFSAAVILALDSISRRAELRRTGKLSFFINGALLLLAVQGFEHMFQ